MGNSGSGKSTLARALALRKTAAILDLDRVFWQPNVPVERPSAERIAAVEQFCRTKDSWIIEGCYSDLIAASFPWNPELIFLDPGPETCLANCRSRPFEPHKFRSPEEQAEHLAYLLNWVQDYYTRDGIMSHQAHQILFASYAGPKRLINRQGASPEADFALPSITRLPPFGLPMGASFGTKTACAWRRSRFSWPLSRLGRCLPVSGLAG